MRAAKTWPLGYVLDAVRNRIDAPKLEKDPVPVEDLTELPRALPPPGSDYS